METTLSKTTLYVLIPPSPLFAAHWSLYIPDPAAKQGQQCIDLKVGRRIHVTGDRLNGFQLEIVRQYDIKKHKGVGTRQFAIAQIADWALQPQDHTPEEQQVQGLEKDEDEGGGFVDNRPIDALEAAVLKIAAPGPSLNSAKNTATSNGRRVKEEVKDCQWRVKQVVRRLLELDMVLPLASKDVHEDLRNPCDILDRLPVH